MPKLLVVDDEPTICWALKKLAESLGYQALVCSSAEQALDSVRDFAPDAMFLDVRLPGMDGLSAMALFRQSVGEAPIVIITAYGDLKTAVEAVRQGAFEYLVKPFDLGQAQRVMERAIAHQAARRQASSAQEADATGDQLHHKTRQVGGLVGKTPAMQEAFKRIALAAASDTCVLLSGESGAGKELAARAIHQFSGRAEGPFVAVNVASLSPALAESELFGHQRGAFTGADHTRQGLLARANGGTLFLDEVADIPLPVQVKLLRALEHGEVLPVGAAQAVSTDFRLVSATHQDLLSKIRGGTFRHDLYYRLCAFQIALPPLRARRDDIKELAEHFLAVCASSIPGANLSPHTTRNIAPQISVEALDELEHRPWRGNVRELRNAIEHALILARGGVIAPEHLPPPAPSTDGDDHQDAAHQSPPRDLENSIVALIESWAQGQLQTSTGPSNELYEQLLRLVEPPLLAAALDKHHGQYAAAARELGMHRTTVKKKANQYGM